MGQSAQCINCDLWGFDNSPVLSLAGFGHQGVVRTGRRYLLARNMILVLNRKTYCRAESHFWVYAFCVAIETFLPFCAKPKGLRLESAYIEFRTQGLPIVSIVVPFFGLTKYI